MTHQVSFCPRPTGPGSPLVVHPQHGGACCADRHYSSSTPSVVIDALEAHLDLLRAGLVDLHPPAVVGLGDSKHHRGAGAADGDLPAGDVESAVLRAYGRRLVGA